MTQPGKPIPEVPDTPDGPPVDEVKNQVRKNSRRVAQRTSPTNLLGWRKALTGALGIVCAVAIASIWDVIRQPIPPTSPWFLAEDASGVHFPALVDSSTISSNSPIVDGGDSWRGDVASQSSDSAIFLDSPIVDGGDSWRGDVASQSSDSADYLNFRGSWSVSVVNFYYEPDAHLEPRFASSRFRMRDAVRVGTNLVQNATLFVSVRWTPSGLPLSNLRITERNHPRGFGAVRVVIRPDAVGQTEIVTDGSVFVDFFIGNEMIHSQSVDMRRQFDTQVDFDIMTQ